MKGVVLAGGLGSRLYPLTHATNKHLLPVYDQPMIYYPIRTLVQAGIKDIMVVTGGPHAGDFIRVLKNGENLGLRQMAYAFQEGEGGIAAALKLAKEFSQDESLAVILGDNCTDADISQDIQSFTEGAKIFLKEVPDPERFGVATVIGENISRIIEKPSNPESNLAVTGLYVYDSTVFDRINKIAPSKRGELEITDVNNLYLQDGKLKWAMLDGYWRDAGTFDTLLEVGNYWAKKEINIKQERG